MITEAEAKTKWCPFANVYVPYQNTGAAGNRGLSTNNNLATLTLCVGSACMAWRWIEPGHKKWVPDDQHTDDGYYQRQAPTHGFCGLAGKP